MIDIKVENRNYNYYNSRIRVKKSLERMSKAKLVEPDNLPVEV
jgi:hypothetical protein